MLLFDPVPAFFDIVEGTPPVEQSVDAVNPALLLGAPWQTVIPVADGEHPVVTVALPWGPQHPPDTALK